MSETGRRTSGGAGAVSDQGERYAVTILADGQAVPLKVFLHDLIGGAVTGLVTGLRGVQDPQHLAIEVRRI